MFTQKKSSYFQDELRAMPHPEQPRFESLCSQQQQLKQMTQEVLKVAMAKYATGSTNCHAQLHGQLYLDLQNGTAPKELLAGFEHFKQLRQGYSRPYHQPKLRGLELSPAGRPMHPSNKAVAKIDDVPQGSFVVSKDVYGQLNEEQRRKLTDKACGMHSYCNVQTLKVTTANPVGWWPEGKGDFGVTVTQSGIARNLHLHYFDFTLSVRKVLPDPVVVKIDAKAGNTYGLVEGERYYVDHKKVELYDPEKHKRMPILPMSALRPFRFADPVGVHADFVDVDGEVTPKHDGTFAFVTAARGTFEVRLRNGVRYLCAYDGPSFEMGIELLGHGYKKLYVMSIHGNLLPLSGPMQQYALERLTFALCGDLHISYDPEEWPSDGMVVRTPRKHFMYKDTKTVDVNLRQISRLREAGLLVDMGDHEFEETDLIEMDVIKGVGVCNPRLRLREGVRDKVLPNSSIKLRLVINSPTTSEWKAAKARPAPIKVE